MGISLTDVPIFPMESKVSIQQPAPAACTSSLFHVPRLEFPFAPALPGLALPQPPLAGHKDDASRHARQCISATNGRIWWYQWHLTRSSYIIVPLLPFCCHITTGIISIYISYQISDITWYNMILYTISIHILVRYSPAISPFVSGYLVIGWAARAEAKRLQPLGRRDWVRVNGLGGMKIGWRKPSNFPWNMGISCKLSQ